MKVYDISFNKQEEIIVKIIYITEKEFDNPDYKFYIGNKLLKGGNNRWEIY